MSPVRPQFARLPRNVFEGTPGLVEGAGGGPGLEAQLALRKPCSTCVNMENAANPAGEEPPHEVLGNLPTSSNNGTPA